MIFGVMVLSRYGVMVLQPQCHRAITPQRLPTSINKIYGYWGVCRRILCSYLRICI